MKKLLVGLLFALSAPAAAQNNSRADAILSDLTGHLLTVESRSSGGEVLSLMCDKAADGVVTLYYRRHCTDPLSNRDDIAFQYGSKDGFDYFVPSCTGPGEQYQQLLIVPLSDREIAEVGRGLNAICRELPFDEAATCR